MIPIQYKPKIKIKASNFIDGKKVNNFSETDDIIKDLNLNTVCVEASCPNVRDCWSRKHASFMIMGKLCTRKCAFCDVTHGKPKPLNASEPLNVAMAVQRMSLRHVVITSVDRDDLPDGGANHFAEVIHSIRSFSPETTIEVLTPDFLDKGDSYKKVIEAKPEVFNHNMDTVSSLYRQIRPSANYFNSLLLLKRVKETDPTIFTKSGFMVGLGETDNDIYQLMDDLRRAEVDFLTISQYLAPSPSHAPVKRYASEEQFEKYKQKAIKKGFLMVSSSALTRSSYHADEDFAELRSRREKLNQEYKKY